MRTPSNSAGQSTRPNDAASARPDSHADARAALRAVLVALVVALPLELLLRVGPGGINVTLGGLLLAIALLIATRAGGRVSPVRVALLAVLVALAGIAALRAPSMLWLAAFVAAAATAVLAVMPDARWLRGTDPVALLARAIVTVARTVAGPLWLIGRALDWSGVLPADRAFARHVRGIAWSIPILIPFLVLFMSADPAFATLATDLVDLSRLASHAFLWGFFAWLTLGWLGTALFPPREYEPVARLGGDDGLWVLGLLTALFAAFVAVQVRYFFGGSELVQEIAGMSYAEYARRGFFELVTVAALLLAVLLSMDWLTRAASDRARRGLRVLSLVLIALLGVIVVSALQRMSLYVDQFGLTQLRFFTTAFMYWLVVVFAWFCASVLRGRREPFLGGVYVSGVAAVLLLAALDPIGRIASHNLEQARRGDRYDPWHLASLGPDAAPQMIASLELLPPGQACIVVPSLLGFADDDSEERDWRWWSRSRQRARALVLPIRDELSASCASFIQSEGATR